MSSLKEEQWAEMEKKGQDGLLLRDCAASVQALARMSTQSVSPTSAPWELPEAACKQCYKSGKLCIRKDQGDWWVRPLPQGTRWQYQA